MVNSTRRKERQPCPAVELVDRRRKEHLPLLLVPRASASPVLAALQINLPLPAREAMGAKRPTRNRRKRSHRPENLPNLNPTILVRKQARVLVKCHLIRRYQPLLRRSIQVACPLHPLPSADLPGHHPKAAQIHLLLVVVVLRLAMPRPEHCPERMCPIRFPMMP